MVLSLHGELGGGVGHEPFNLTNALERYHVDLYVAGGRGQKYYEVFTTHSFSPFYTYTQ